MSACFSQPPYWSLWSLIVSPPLQDCKETEKNFLVFFMSLANENLREIIESKRHYADWSCSHLECKHSTWSQALLRIKRIRSIQKVLLGFESVHSSIRKSNRATNPADLVELNSKMFRKWFYDLRASSMLGFRSQIKTHVSCIPVKILPCQCWPNVPAGFRHPQV